ncbi:MAG TPA: hypothetical protein VGO11_19645 [Chthoniobacteraceae bacterium]|jgi:hypothetical protein|nr:hypothetical protein [Chthoniobacteraceae bacterium]
MRTAVTIGRRHEEDAPEVLAGPAVPIREQQQVFRAATRTREHPEYAELELWTSDEGCVKRRKFSPPAAAMEGAAPSAPGADTPRRKPAPKGAKPASP